MNNEKSRKKIDKTLFLRNQVFCQKICTFWRAPSTLEFNGVFLLEFCTCFLLINVYGRCSRFLLFCLNLELFAKIKKAWFLHSFFTFLLTIQDLNKIQKSWTTYCRHYQLRNVCKISSKNIIKSVVVGGRQSFQFFR